MSDPRLVGDEVQPIYDSPATDSAGLPWTGRVLTGTGFDGDLGAADANLLAALQDPQDEAALMRAVAQARLLVPVVAVPGGSDDAVDSAEPTATGPVDTESTAAASSPAEAAASTPAESDPSRPTEMAVVTLTASDGQRGFPVFSSLATLSAWQPAARPSPVTSQRAAQGAVAERCDVMLLDHGSPHERVLRPSMVWALAQQREWLPAHTDPFVAHALIQATADEEDVVSCIGGADSSAPGMLRVELSLRPGLDAIRVKELATRIGERIATDGEARARIDGLSFAIRSA